MKWLALIALTLVIGAAMLASWRALDRKTDRNSWNSLPLHRCRNLRSDISATPFGRVRCCTGQSRLR